MCYEEVIALRLAIAYNKNPQGESFGISTNTVYPEYYSGEKDGVLSLDMESFARFHRLVESLVDKGFISARQDRKTSVYKRITATAEQVRQLAGLYNLTLLPEYRERMRAVLFRHTHSNSQRIRDWISGELEERDLANVKTWFAYDVSGGIAEKEKGLDELLCTCEAISRLKEDVLMRNFSVSRALGSKGFEQTMKKRVCAVLAPVQLANGIEPNEILKSFHILQNPASVWLKGHGRIHFQNGDVLTCSDYNSPLALTRDWVERIESIRTNALLTIENLTTFNDYNTGADELVVYTSGFANALIITFLRKCASDNQFTSARHFGDMDAFGFEILRDLSCRTEIRIEPYLMDVSTYEANKARAIDMTEKNRSLFGKLLEDTFFSTQDKTLFHRLLEDEKTLEQEGVLLMPVLHLGAPMLSQNTITICEKNHDQ